MRDWVQKVRKKAIEPSSEVNTSTTQKSSLIKNEAKPAEEIFQSASTTQFWRKKRSREPEVEANTTEKTELKAPKK